MLAEIFGWFVIISALSVFVWMIWPERTNTYADRDKDFTDGGQG